MHCLTMCPTSCVLLRGFSVLQGRRGIWWDWMPAGGIPRICEECGGCLPTALPTALSLSLSPAHVSVDMFHSSTCKRTIKNIGAENLSHRWCDWHQKRERLFRGLTEIRSQCRGNKEYLSLTESSIKTLAMTWYLCWRCGASQTKLETCFAFLSHGTLISAHEEFCPHHTVFIVPNMFFSFVLFSVCLAFYGYYARVLIEFNVDIFALWILGL
jgi:hypothetical protein